MLPGLERYLTGFLLMGVIYIAVIIFGVGVAYMLNWWMGPSHLTFTENRQDATYELVPIATYEGDILPTQLYVTADGEFQIVGRRKVVTLASGEVQDFPGKTLVGKYQDPWSGTLYLTYQTIDHLLVLEELESQNQILRILWPEEKDYIHEQYVCVHVGGQVVSPLEGELWLSVGEGSCLNPGGFTDAPQRRDNYYGKVLKIRRALDVDEWDIDIMAYGLRNPWRMALQQGYFVVTDVGEGTWEEINLMKPGANFGWPMMEGTDCYYDLRVTKFPNDPRKPTPFPCDKTDYQEPLYQYDHSLGGCGIIGGEFMPDSLEYLFTDLCTGEISSINVQTGAVTTVIQTGEYFLRAFARYQGDVYVLGHPVENPAWTVYRLRQSLQEP